MMLYNYHSNQKFMGQPKRKKAKSIGFRFKIFLICCLFLKGNSHSFFLNTGTFTASFS